MISKDLENCIHLVLEEIGATRIGFNTPYWGIEYKNEQYTLGPLASILTTELEFVYFLRKWKSWEDVRDGKPHLAAMHVFDFRDPKSFELLKEKFKNGF